MAQRPLALFAALAPALSGCATSVTVFEEDPDNLVYSGTRRDLDGGVIIHGGILDLPFSFIADTILLPYTITRTIWNYATAEDESEAGDGDEGGGAS